MEVARFQGGFTWRYDSAWTGSADVILQNWMMRSEVSILGEGKLKDEEDGKGVWTD